jgi:hypothetical protein
MSLSHELDISELFDDPDLTHTQGLRIWRIEDFKPVEVRTRPRWEAGKGIVPSCGSLGINAAQALDT